MSPQEHLAQWAEDLRTLAWLHAAERPSAVWHALNAAGFPTGLALLSPQHAAVQAMNAALRSLGERAAGDPGRTDDALAADYAAIYLTHAFRASPCESVWRDEDHLAHRNFKRPLACLWPLESPTDAWVAGRYRPGWLGTDGCDIVLS